MMLPVCACFKDPPSLYAPVEASTRCLGFQAKESTTLCCEPLIGRIQGFLAAQDPKAEVRAWRACTMPSVGH